MNKRKIPTTMVTQHPDHAGRPYWHDKTYLSTADETEEAYLSFSELGATEYKWDWEGKLVDESVIERLFGKHIDYFQKHPLGVDNFITFRLPNPRVETEFRMGRSFMSLASGASVAKHFGFKTPPMFEVILPMTENAEEMLDLQVAFLELRALKHPLYKMDSYLTNLRIIPLFESVEKIVDAANIVEKYLSLYKKRFAKLPPYMRPYVARSDPALNSGMIPTVIAIKIALSRFANLSKKLGIPLYPIIGCGSLPFRGGLTPLNIQSFAHEYKGVRTVTLQSAFRYDYEKNDVIKAISELAKILPKQKTNIISVAQEKELLSVISVFEKEYKKTIEQIAPVINEVAAFIPKRRERVQHTGLFGYSRGEDKVKLPRAISFTCALYSIGIPPELIGTGRGLAAAQKSGKIEILEKYFLNLKEDLTRAGRYLNKSNLEKLAKKSSVWKEVLADVKQIEEYLGMELGAKTADEKKHQKVTEKILSELSHKSPKLPALIKQGGLLRKSLG